MFKVAAGGSVTTLATFLAYGSAFTGGVNVGAADFDGDRRAELVTGAGAGAAPHVKVFKAP
jgi:hypothetical protein